MKAPHFRNCPLTHWTSALVLPILSLTVVLAAQAGSNLLADAVESRETARISELLASPIDVNAPQVDGMTALHWAAHHDDGELGLKLLTLSANASAQNRYGITPLYLACVNGNANLVRGLLGAGADANTAVKGGETALMTASRTGRIGAVLALIGAGAEIDARERNEQTAIMWVPTKPHSSATTEKTKSVCWVGRKRSWVWVPSM